MDELKGLIFSIEEFAVYDGPGIRTSVFFKGCPLRCNWCHNPEGLEMRAQIVRSPNGCLGCGRCDAIAKKHGGEYTQEAADACPRHLLRPSGVWYGADELCAKLLKNTDLLRAGGGGVTFSGGECLMQADFLTEVAKKLHGKLHLAIQTSGYAPADKLRGLLPYLDLVMFDLKLMDAAQFRKYIGGDLSVVLRSFRIAAESGVELLPRTPLIPGVTDTPENLNAVAETIASAGLHKAELLAYNKMAGSKYKLIGKTYAPMFDESKAGVPDLTPFKERGIEVRIL